MPALFSLRRPALIGVVHLAPLAGAPRYRGSLGPVLSAARRDAHALARGGCDALIVENFGDVPFHASSVPPETIACMARALEALRADHPRIRLGVNVLRNDARAALGLAAAFELDFVRVNVHAGAALTDQGLIEGRAAETLRERARLCPRTQIWADVHVKHATQLSDATLAESAAELAGRALADALIVTGRATGSAPSAAQVAEVAEVTRVPLLVGSGIDLSNARVLLEHAQGAIVGTALKRAGRVEESRVRALAALFGGLARRRAR